MRDYSEMHEKMHPPAKPEVAPVELDYRWVSCSKDASWSAAEFRHLIIPGHLTTVCGSTASHPDVWRTNTTKMNCRVCTEKGKDIIEAQMAQLLGPVAEEPKAAEEDPRADYKRAFEIKKRLEKVVSLADQILEELVAVKGLMSYDYPDVAKYETKDVEDLRTILKVAFRRPIYVLVNRWVDNSIGRTPKG